MLTNVRAGLGKTEGASLVDGLLVVRVVAADGYALRKRLMPLIGRLAHARCR